MERMTLESFLNLVRTYQQSGQPITPGVIDDWAKVMPEGYTIGFMGEIEVTIGTFLSAGVEGSGGYFRGSSGEGVWVGQFGVLGGVGVPGRAASLEGVVVIAKGEPKDSFGPGGQIELAVELTDNVSFGMGVTVPRDALVTWLNGGIPIPLVPTKSCVR